MEKIHSEYYFPLLIYTLYKIDGVCFGSIFLHYSIDVAIECGGYIAYFSLVKHD